MADVNIVKVFSIESSTIDVLRCEAVIAPINEDHTRFCSRVIKFVTRNTLWIYWRIISLVKCSTRDTKHICATSSLEESNRCASCSQPSCSYGQCDGHPPATSTSQTKDPVCVCINKTQNCMCKSRLSSIKIDACTICSGKSATGEPCKKCDNAKLLEMDNSKTKCKLEQLRLVMQQKKQRREARKLKTLPYSASPKAHGPPDQTSPIKEEIESVA